MRTSKVLTDIFFEPGQGFDVRAALTFSDATKVRLDPEDFRLKLKLQSDFRYPVDADLNIRSQTFEPKSVRELLMIQVFGTFPGGTSAGFRIYDGTDELWWDGTSWSIAAAGEWNTEDEVNQNLSAFDVSARTFAVVVNLTTTDNRYTPEIELIRILWDGPVDWHDDILIDSLIGMFQDELTYIGDAALPPVSSAVSSITLGDYLTKSNLNVVGVDAVFDDLTDPNHLVDLLSGYDSGTGVITLNGSLPIGGIPFIRLFIAPEVAWSTHQDFEEVGKVPAIVLRDTRTIRSSKYPSWAGSGIVRKDNAEAWEISPPLRLTFEVTAELRTDSTREQHRLQEAFLRIFEEGPSTEAGPFLRSRATDRRFRIWLLEEFNVRTPPENTADLRVHQAEFRIQDVAIQSKRAIQSFGVLATKLGFNRIDSEESSAAKANDAPEPTTPLETITIEV